MLSPETSYAETQSRGRSIPGINAQSFLTTDYTDYTDGTQMVLFRFVILSRAMDPSFCGRGAPTPRGMTGEGTRPTAFLGSFARLR
jgi:hypothetical protein